MCRAPTSNDARYYTDSDGTPWVTTAELRENYISSTRQQVTQEALDDYSTLRVYRPGSVMMAMYGATIGRLGITEVAATCNQACCVFEASEQFDNRFLFYWLWHRRGDLIAMSVGGGQPNLSQQDLREERALCPPPDTQRQIARFLDEKTARIDGLIEKKRALLDRLAEKRQALITRAVTKGINPDAPMKPSGIDWLGDIPAHWECRQLKRLVEDGIGLQMGPFGGMLTNLPDYETGFKLYGQENTISGDFSRGSRWVEEERYEELKRYELLPGDLVITRKGSLGNCRRVPEGIAPGIADSDTIRIRPNRLRLIPEWALLLLHEALFVSEQIAAERRGAILSGLNTAVVGGLILTLPPVTEQRALMDHLGALLSPIGAIAERVRDTIDKLVEYRAALITTAVTGQIPEVT
ncbi:restriction endonuclease subunit S [Thiocapsa rosea]|uniref:restriction endonuclease subunit S n=1 Tax=Thiocapsa rosea TaxID=69360 RepID=UPI0024830855|nr:restriction endonuclease subunit S [Thiocapsa rosea]